jgi:hypothetical protein
MDVLARSAAIHEIRATAGDNTVESDLNGVNGGVGIDSESAGGI